GGMLFPYGHPCILSAGSRGRHGQSLPCVPVSRPVFHCGGNLNAESGFVASEAFPSFYKPNSKCTWYITVPEGNVVILSFRVFDLEADSLCRYDYVDVYNGHSHIVQKLGRFCGTFRPGSLISTTNTMMLEMVSDSGNGGRGFLAYFSSGKPHVDEHQFCGGKLTKSQGSVKTPNWPEKNYPPSISCSWLITVEPDMVVEVTFDKFDVESDTYCRFDYVAFFNGGEKEDSRLIGKYCGDTAPQSVVSNGNVLLVQFVSDPTVTSDGFMANYHSIPQGSKSPTTGGAIIPRPRVESPAPREPVKPARPEQKKPIIIETPITTTVKPKPVKPVRPPVRKPLIKTVTIKPRVRLNPLCAQACKKDGTMKTSFCSSEFVITGRITTMSPRHGGALLVTVSLIKAYKAGRLTITQAGADMSVKLLSACKKCPLLRRGGSFILMGQVDQDGVGTLSPGSFTAPYKGPHHKILNNLNNQQC
uniref:Procollagen C-endopeptidase enhancer n=1 Tax=Denticeps clupeoides TaxID=299321 RepID=A0AAY3ZWK1_9TELE